MLPTFLIHSWWINANVWPNHYNNDIFIFRVDKDTTPSCGVEDYVNTWNDFYDAANLKETYNFLSPQPASSSYGQASFAGRQGLREISPANLTNRAAWSPLADDYGIDTIKPRSDSPTSTSSSGSVIRWLTVSTLPPVMEYRVCELATSLRTSLSCLTDDTLQALYSSSLKLSLFLKRTLLIT